MGDTKEVKGLQEIKNLIALLDGQELPDSVAHIIDNIVKQLNSLIKEVEKNNRSKLDGQWNNY